MPHSDEKPIANPYVMLREEFDDWAILFDPDTGHGFGLSPTGVYVWKLLDGEYSIDDMVNALRRDAENVPEEAGEQIMAFAEALRSHGLAGRKGEPGYNEKRRPSPSSGSVRMMGFPYEPPVLVNLSGQQQAAGYCGGGSSATAGCNPTGHLATCCSYGTGDYVGGCCPGNCIGTSCNCGDCICGDPCQMNCNAVGNCPQYYCMVGGTANQGCESGTTAGYGDCKGGGNLS